MAPEVKIKITAAAELSALRSLNDSLAKQVIQAKALGKDYQDLEKDLQRVQKAMADIKPPSFLDKGKNALSEIFKELPVIGAITRNFNGQTPLIGAAVGGAVLGVQAAKSFGEGVVKAAEYADQMEELGMRTGQSAADAIVMTQAFKNVGLDAGNVGPAINMLQMALTGLNEEGLPTKGVFDSLGLSLEALKDMAPINALQAISEKIAGLGSAADKTRAVKDLFGKAGGSLLPLLGDNKAFDTARTQVGDLAETIDKSSADLGKFADAWAGLDVKKMQLFAGFAAELSGSLGSAADHINEMDFTKIGEGLANFTKGAGSLAGDFYDNSQILQHVVGGFKAVAAYGELRKVQEQTAETDKTNAQLEADIKERMADPAKQAEHLRSIADSGGSTGKGTMPVDDGGANSSYQRLRTRDGATEEELKKARDADRFKRMTPQEQLAGIDKTLEEARAASRKTGLSDEDYSTQVKKVVALEQQRLEVLAKISDEKKKTQELDSSNTSKREALDLELSIKEAQAAGNKDLVAKLQWQKEYSALLKAGVDAKDPDAWNKARRGANASMEDPLATAREIEKQARSAVQLSSLGRLGMAMGESSNASQTVTKLQEMIVAQQTSSAALAAIQKNTAEMAKKRGGYQ
jgi:hypothetical protein